MANTNFTGYLNVTTRSTTTRELHTSTYTFIPAQYTTPHALHDADKIVAA